jgi:hypothetical protein
VPQDVRLEVIHGCPELGFRLKLEDRIIAKGDIQHARWGYEVLLSLLTPVRISNELLYEIRVNMCGGQLLEKGGFSSPVRAGYGNQPPLLLMKLVVCLIEDILER